MPKLPEASRLPRPLRLGPRAVVLVIVIVLVATVYLLFRRSDSSATKIAENSALGLEAEGARSIIVREHGKKLWQFAARRIELSADGATATAREVSNGVLFHDGVPLWRLRAMMVRLDQRRRDVDATGGVAASGPNGLHIDTVHAVWLERSERLLCPQAVHASMRGMNLSTGAASYNVLTDELRCTQAVAITSKWGVLTSPRATARPRSGTVSFEGGVDLVFHSHNLPILPQGLR